MLAVMNPQENTTRCLLCSRHQATRVRRSISSSGNRYAEVRGPEDAWCELVAQCEEAVGAGTQLQRWAGARQEEPTVSCQGTSTEVAM